MTSIEYKKQIKELNLEANDLRKRATKHVKTVMTELIKYVRSIRKASDAIAVKSEQLLNKRLKETRNDPKYENDDIIADRLDELQMTDIASDAFWHINKIVEDNKDNYELDY